MGYIGIGILLILNGFVLFFGISTQAFRMPFNFGEYSTLAGAFFMLSGILLVIRGFKYERVKRELLDEDSAKHLKSPK